MLDILNESLVLAIACIAGVTAFRRMNTFHRLIFFQVIAWTVFYIVSWAVVLWQQAHGTGMNNHAVYNVHMVIETGLLMAAAHTLFGAGWMRWLVKGLFLVFIGVFSAQVFSGGINVFANYGNTAACFALTIVYALALHRAFAADAAWWKNPGIYACTGILIYFACIIPYFTSFGYLQRAFPELSAALFDLIIIVLANVRYLFVAIAFWLVKGGHHG